MDVCSFSSSDWLSLAAVLVNILAILIGASVAFKVASSIQRKLNNDGKLKDYYANELISLKNEYQHVIEKVYYDTPTPLKLKAEINSLSKQITSTMRCLHDIYNIEDTLADSLLEFSTIVMECPEYENCANDNNPIDFSEETKRKVLDIQSSKTDLFNRILSQVYVSDRF